MKRNRNKFARGKVFFHSLSLSVFTHLRILNRTHYLRAIIMPKTNSYFLLRNQKLINQSSRGVAVGSFLFFFFLKRGQDNAVRPFKDSNGRNFLWNFVIMGSLFGAVGIILTLGSRSTFGFADHKNFRIKLKAGGSYIYIYIYI